MAEKKGVGHAYNVDFLNVVFAASSLFLFLSVIWMVWDDFNRDWKNTQREFARLELDVTRASSQQASGARDAPKLRRARRRAHRRAQERGGESRQNRRDPGQARRYRRAPLPRNAGLPVLQGDLRFRPLHLRGRNAPRAIRERPGKRRRSPIWARASATLNLIVEKTTAERAVISKELETFTGERTAIQKQIDEMNANYNRLRTQVSALAPSAVKDYFRNAPLLDFMAPTIKVNQIILPNVLDDVNFTKVPKMDRCTTCHLAIDRVGYEKYPQPFKTHPEPAEVHRQRLAASDGSGRLHGVPRGHGAVGDVPRRRPCAA